MDAPTRSFPSPRQVAVARAYVEGLERDRIHLAEAESRLQQTVWEVTQLAGYNRALFFVLKEIVEARDAGLTYRFEDALKKAADVLDANKPIFEDVWQCPCGHSKYDHDEKGCQFLGCKHICGGEQ